MDDLEDELDLRYHHGLTPDVYYRCPSSESLDGALRNEFDSNAASLIPTDVVTEFVFGKTSTITVPVTQQPNLDSLFEPADYPQSITVDHALCHGIEGKERLKLQRAIARSFIEMIQEIDGFRYTEHHAWNKDGSDGARYKYICLDSSLHRGRKSRAKKKNDAVDADSSNNQNKDDGSRLPTHDCGGAIHVRFSTTREAVNVMYVHNPIHRDVESRPESQIPDVVPINGAQTNNGTKPKKRRKSNINAQAEAGSSYRHPDLDMSTTPEISKASTNKKRKKHTTRPVTKASGTNDRVEAYKITLASAQKGARASSDSTTYPACQRQLPPLSRERNQVQRKQAKL